MSIVPSHAPAPLLLFVVNDGPFMISHRLSIASAARRAGYDVHVAMPPDARAAAILAQEGCRVHELQLDRRAADLRGEWRLFRSLCRLYRELRPAIVHHITVKPVLYGSLARQMTGGGPIVNAVPGLGYLFLARGVKARLRRSIAEGMYRLALRGRDTISIFQNPDDIALFVGRRLVNPKQVVLIRGSGVDLTLFTPVAEPQGTPLVVLPARMLRDKGVVEFVDAARSLRAKGVVARFALVGGHDVNRAAIDRNQLESWQQEGAVEWWDYRADMVQVYREAAIVCLPSYREGVPKALLEAAASARPIVTCDVPGCREVVTEGENGLLVPSRNSVALAAALESLLGNAPLRAQMGRAGRLRAEREFSAADVAAVTLEIYSELLRARVSA